MKLLFAGGGSIGHIAPSVAVLRAAQKIDPQTEGFFVCSLKDDDAAFLQKEHLSFQQIAAPRLSFSLPFILPGALREARNVLRRVQPDVVFCKGGSIGVPVALAARKLGIPIILHESDAVSGYANRFIARFADVVCKGFPAKKTNAQTKTQIPNQQPATSNQQQFSRTPNPELRIPNPASHFTGNPIRQDITQGDRNEGLRLTRFSGNKPIVLILGGSQGATTINTIVIDRLHELLPLCDIIHLTGRGKESAVHTEGYWSTPFAFEELPHLYAITTIALSRAGAGSVSELAANAIPTFLVPLRGVGHDHQLRNAERVETLGGCILLHQETLREKLVPAIASLLSNPDRQKWLATHIWGLHQPDAAGKIARILLGYGGRKP